MSQSRLRRLHPRHRLGFDQTQVDQPGRRFGLGHQNGCDYPCNHPAHGRHQRHADQVDYQIEVGSQGLNHLRQRGRGAAGLVGLADHLQEGVAQLRQGTGDGHRHTGVLGRQPLALA